jgi:hypothetical protein
MNQQPAMTQDQVKDAFYKTTFTLKGRIFHPNLLSTRTKTNQATGGSRDVFDVMFAWDPADQSNGPELNKLLQFMGQMSGMVFFGIDPRALVDPIKSDSIQGRTDYVRTDYKPNAAYLKGRMWINAETGKDMPPVVVMANRQPVMSEAEVYSGRNAVVNFQLYPMLRDPQKPNKKIGYGVNLNAVMLLDGGDKEGGRAAVDVNSVFGGFAQDMGMAPAFGNFGQAPAQAPQQNFQAPPQQNFQAPPVQNQGYQQAPAPQQNFQAPPFNPGQQGNGQGPQGNAAFNPGTTQYGQQPTMNGSAQPASPSNGQQQPPWMNNGQNFNPGQGR